MGNHEISPSQPEYGTGLYESCELESGSAGSPRRLKQYYCNCRLAQYGKSTLFNKIKGQNLSPASSQAGNTRTLVRTDFGPFTLVDTPGHLPDVMESGLAQASVIVFLIDGSKGLQAEDRELFDHIRPLRKPTIVVINKIDAIKAGEGGDHLATEVAIALDTPGVIPISAKTGENIVEELIPVIIEASPEAALAIGRELPAYRREAAQRIIRNATLVSLAAGLEPIPFIDIPILAGNTNASSFASSGFIWQACR